MDRKLVMTKKAKDRRRRWIESNRTLEALVNRVTPPLRLEEVALSGFGGHSKAHPITMTRGKNQTQWRKKIRRMDHRTRKQFFKASGQ